MSVTYKGIEYPTRDLSIMVNGNRQDITISTVSLATAFDPCEQKAITIDESLYFYIEDEYWDKSDEEIAKNHLDDEFELAPDEDD